MAHIKDAYGKNGPKAKRPLSRAVISLLIICGIIGLSGCEIDVPPQESPENRTVLTEPTPSSQPLEVSAVPTTEPPEVSAVPTLEPPEESVTPASEHPAISESPAENTPEAKSNSNNNFNSYNNPEQQETEDTWVLNTRSKKIHYPSCRDVKKISPKNYSTSNLTEDELIAQGYSTCGTCH